MLIYFPALPSVSLQNVPDLLTRAYLGGERLAVRLVGLKGGCRCTAGIRGNGSGRNRVFNNVSRAGQLSKATKLQRHGSCGDCSDRDILLTSCSCNSLTCTSVSAKKEQARACVGFRVLPSEITRLLAAMAVDAVAVIRLADVVVCPAAKLWQSNCSPSCSDAFNAPHTKYQSA